MAKNAKEAPKQEFKEELNDPMIEEVVAEENAPENVVEEENTEIKEPELSKEEKEKVATQMAKSYGEVVRRLRRGDRVSGFTLIPTNKAHKNHTVEPLVDLDDNQTLCGIKPEYL